MTRTLDRRQKESIISYNKADLQILLISEDTVFGTISISTKHTHLGPAIVVESRNGSAILTDSYEYHWTGVKTKTSQTADGSVRELLSTYDAAGNPLTLSANSPTGASWSKTLKIDTQYHPSSPDTDKFNRIMIGSNDTPSKRIITHENNYLGIAESLKFSDGANNDLSTLQYGYDKYLHITRIAGSDHALDINLERDFIGNVVNHKEPADGSVVDLSYTYDGMNRLTSGEGDALTFDELSNLSTRGSRKYYYQDSGTDSSMMRLKRFVNGSSTFEYEYDEEGNIASVSGLFTSLKYDNLNRMREIDHVSGQVDKYWYDRNGLRFKREEDSGGTNPIRTYSIYQGNTLVLQEKYIGSTKTETRLNIVVGAQVLGHIKKVYAGSESLELFYSDHLGSRRVVIDNAGIVLDTFKYSAWGEVTHTHSGNDYLASFTGKEYDATGLIYFNARYYDPTIGRFITEDPSRKGTGWYTYCGNNPINNIDPDGNNFFEVAGNAIKENWRTSASIVASALPLFGTAYNLTNAFYGKDYFTGEKLGGAAKGAALASAVISLVPVAGTIIAAKTQAAILTAEGQIAKNAATSALPSGLNKMFYDRLEANRAIETVSKAVEKVGEITRTITEAVGSIVGKVTAPAVQSGKEESAIIQSQ